MLVAGAFFGRWAGSVVFAMYLASILLVAGIGLLGRHTLSNTWSAPPLVHDLVAVEGGAVTIPQLCRTTGMTRPLVEAGIDHLVQTGRLRTTSMLMSCSAHCRACVVAKSCPW